MRARVSALVLIPAAVLALASAGQSTNPRVALQQEVEAQALLMAQAFERGDMKAVARFYADDARIYASGKRVEGRTDIEEFWNEIRHPSSWLMQTVDVGGSRDEPYLMVRSTLVEKWSGHADTSRTMCLMTWRRGSDGKLKIQNDVFAVLSKREFSSR
jgi:ketosteroid isomerase-like protein